MRLKIQWIGIGVMLAMLMMTAASMSMSVSAQSGNCVIPAAGPWPDCANGGNAWNSGSNCQIPPAGPWPACARGGGNAPAPAWHGGGDCVIPPAGVWPACARGRGNIPAPSGNGSCVIPAAGAWPACATGRQTLPDSTDDCIIPSTGPWPDCATGGPAVDDEEDMDEADETEMDEDSSDEDTESESESEMDEDEDSDSSDEDADEDADMDDEDDPADTDDEDDDEADDEAMEEEAEEAEESTSPDTDSFAYSKRDVRDMMVEFMNYSITDDINRSCELNKCWQPDAEMEMGNGVLKLISFEVYQEGKWDEKVIPDNEEDGDDKDTDGNALETTDTKHEITLSISAVDGKPVIDIIEYRYNWQNRSDDTAEVERIKRNTEEVLLAKLQADLEFTSIESITLGEELMTIEYR